MTMRSEGEGGLRISVVIATRNRAQQLARTLQALCEQTISPQIFEVVVVDNGSSDATQEVARGFAASLPNLQVLREPKPGAAAARNRGIQASRAETILFLDDDVIADPHLIAQHLLCREQHPRAAILGAVRLPWKGDESAFLACLAWRPELLQSFNFPDPNNVPFQHFYSCNLSLPKEFFAQQGFDETFSSYGFEDPELGLRFARTGAPIIFRAEASALHDVRVTFSEFCGKRYSSGRWARHMTAKYPETKAVLVGGSRWRQRISDAIGMVAAPIAPIFDRKPGRLGRFWLPLLAFFCWHRLQYCFRRGVSEGGDAAANRSELAGTHPSE